MQAVLVNEKDIETIDGWWKAHKGQGFPEGWLPPTGYWVPGVLAAFMYKTDSKVAYIECVVSNPESKKQDRYEALTLVGHAIIAEAQKQGFSYLLGLTSLPSVAECGEKEGLFKISEFKYAIMAKNLVENT